MLSLQNYAIAGALSDAKKFLKTLIPTRVQSARAPRSDLLSVWHVLLEYCPFYCPVSCWQLVVCPIGVLTFDCFAFAVFVAVVVR